MESQGLSPMFWSNSQWDSMTCIAFNYPYDPTQSDKKKYRTYFMSLIDVLPCCTCRKHYDRDINNGFTKLTDDDLKNRESLTKWLYKFHKNVCKNIGYDYDITYEMMCDKYNSYIAYCDLSKEQIKTGYRNMYLIDAPVLKFDVLLCFKQYAIERGIKNYYEDIIKYSKMDRNSEEWKLRNKKCREIIQHMQTQGIDSIEISGKYKKMPSVTELKLMAYTSTTIKKKDIKKIIIYMLEKEKGKIN